MPPDYSLTALQVLEGAWTHPWAVPHASAYMLVAWDRLMMSDQVKSDPGLIDDREDRARGLFPARKSAKDFLDTLVAIALNELPRPQGQPSELDPAKEKQLLEKLLNVALAAQERYRRPEVAPGDVLFPGVLVGRNRVSGWVANLAEGVAARAGHRHVEHPPRCQRGGTQEASEVRTYP